MTDPHRWFRSRLEAHLSGLLDEAGDARFLAHAHACAACAARLAEVLADDQTAAAAAAHLPAGVVAAWPRARRELRGLERRMVAAHLARCADCRGELVRLGHEPRLEPGVDDALPRPAGTRRRRAVALGGAWAAAAAFVAVMLLHRGGDRTPAPPRPAPPAATPPAAPAPAPAPGGAAVLVTLEGPQRGEVARTVPRVEAGGARFLHLAAPPLDLPDAARVTVMLEAPSGRVVRLEAVNADFFGGRGIVFDGAGGAWPAGRYRLRLEGAHADGRAERADYVFDLDAPGR